MPVRLLRPQLSLGILIARRLPLTFAERKRRGFYRELGGQAKLTVVSNPACSSQDFLAPALQLDHQLAPLRPGHHRAQTTAQVPRNSEKLRFGAAAPNRSWQRRNGAAEQLQFGASSSDLQLPAPNWSFCFELPGSNWSCQLRFGASVS